MNKLSIILILIFFNCSNAIEYDHKIDIEDPLLKSSICKIFYENKLQCTGTLLSNRTEILTAGHCMPQREMKNVSVECGGYSALGDFKGHLTFEYGESKYLNPQVGVDVAKIKLSQKLGDPNSKKMGVQIYDLKNKLDLSHLNCVTAGFGYQSKEFKVYGELLFAQLDSVYFDEMTFYIDSPSLRPRIQMSGQTGFDYNNSQGYEQKIQVIKTEPIVFNKGDSGGPILCRDNTTENYKIVAVLSGSFSGYTPLFKSYLKAL